MLTSQKKLIRNCLISAAGLTLIACEPPPVQCEWGEIEVAGLCIQSELPVSAEEVEVLVTVLESEVQRRYPSVEDIQDTFRENKVHVEFIDSALAINCERYERDIFTCDINIHGVNYEGWDIYCVYEECLGWSSLAHELMHSIERFYPDDVNVQPDHMTPWFFEEYGANNVDVWWNTVEVRMWRNLVCNLESCAGYRDHWMCEAE